ncbi:MAG: hypothetical protein ACRDZX_14295 [Acidimicrobiales bacterium]
MTEPGENLSRVLSVWGEILRTGSTSALGSLLDDSVAWQGVLPELACHGREEVLHLLGRAAFARITRVEAEELGSSVVVSVESTDFPEGPAGPELTPAGGGRHIVFTFQDAKVVKMASFPDRGSALAPARGLVH